MKAVILAAGTGSRLRPITDTLPKALIPIHDKPLIIYSLKNLLSVGIREVWIVTGHQAQKLETVLGTKYSENLQIHYIHNQRYKETGSMFSLSLLEGKINGDILLLESDLLYDRMAVKELVHHSAKDVTVVAPLSGSGDEVVIQTDIDGLLSNLGKNLSKNSDAMGELAGITKLSYVFLQEMWAMAQEDYKNGILLDHYEEVMARVAQTSRTLNCLYLENLNWIEIDKEMDLEQANNKIFPALKLDGNNSGISSQ